MGVQFVRALTHLSVDRGAYQGAKTVENCFGDQHEIYEVFAWLALTTKAAGMSPIVKTAAFKYF